MAPSSNTTWVDPVIPNPRETKQALDRLLGSSDSPLGDCDESPVFVLALGWGSGSTLIQRVLMTDPSLLIWGEPYGRMGLLTSVTSALTAVTDKWPRDKFYRDLRGDELIHNFVANTYPPAVDLIAGYREQLLRTYAEPARRREFARWGIKEVRLSAPDAVLLSTLFPKARFIVVARNPYDCWRSSQDMQTRWRYDAVVERADTFAHLWARMATTWAEAPDGLGRLVVRYEDVIGPGYDFSEIERFAGLSLEPDKALSVRSGQRGDRRELSGRDRKTIGKIAGRAMKTLGYEP